MNDKKKSIVITVFVLILALGFLYWYFSLRNTKTSLVQLTDQQKMAILSETSSEPVEVISYDEKQKILNNLDATIQKPITNFSNEEKLQILNQTN